MSFYEKIKRSHQSKLGPQRDEMKKTEKRGREEEEMEQSPSKTQRIKSDGISEMNKAICAEILLLNRRFRLKALRSFQA